MEHIYDIMAVVEFDGIVEHIRMMAFFGEVRQVTAP
jgi:hypothetical protein